MEIRKSELPSTPLGIYIHIPFCKSKCLYCDFCSFAGASKAQIDEYIAALITEMSAHSEDCKDLSVDTVYLGGGTPSLLSPEQLTRIMDALKREFFILPDAEITLECNPMTVAEDALGYFRALHSLAFNRLSIGVQSAVDAELKLIGRRHGFSGAASTFYAAREAGFGNISVDLMLGLPLQTIETLEYSVRALCSLDPEHISVYSLQLEEGSALYRLRDRFELPDEELCADMYELSVKLLREYGYSHYEISNFARLGKESRHNSKYWSLSPYLGLGLSAHSDIFGSRLENTKNMNDYLSGRWNLTEKSIGTAERELEFLMLGLRTSRGISKKEFFSRFGADFDKKYGEKVKKLEKAGFFERNDEFLSLNEKGFEVSNEILTQILDFDY